MKKLCMTAAVLSLIFALTACSGGQKTPAETGSSAPAQTDDSAASAGEAATIHSYMGQVSDKVGNDITVSLGEIVLDSGEGSDEVAYVDENGNQEIRPRDDEAFVGEGSTTTIVPMPEDAAGRALRVLPVMRLRNSFPLSSPVKCVNSPSRPVQKSSTPWARKSALTT